MRAPAHLDASVARRMLTAHLGRHPGPVELVGEDTWSRCFGCRDAGRDLVLRIGTLVEDFGRDRHAAAHRSPALDAGVARLAVLAEAGEGRRHVVHGDLVNRNVLTAGGTITGVLDWACALDGDPVLSYAELELWAPWHPGLAAVDVRAMARAHLQATGGDAADLDARIDAGAIYLALAGLSFWLATEHPDGDDRARLLDRYLSR